MYSCRSTSSKVSPAALSKDNDLKENRLLFKLNLFLLSYPHILSLPPKGAGSLAKKPVFPGFFAWGRSLTTWGRSFCVCPHCSYSGQGDRHKRTVPLNQKRPPAQIRTGGRCFSRCFSRDGPIVSVPIVPVQDKGTETKGPSP